MNERTPQGHHRFPQIHIVDVSPDHVHLWDRPSRSTVVTPPQRGPVSRFLESLSSAAVDRGLFAASAKPDLIIANGL